MRSLLGGDSGRGPSRAGTARRILGGVAVGSLLVSGLSLADVGAPAEAAPGPNPNVTLTIAQVFDGAGHGTPAASFVNSANGFAPGDDTATDGVVSSGDDVGYEVELRIAAGPARTVALQMNADPMLGWESSKADFCAPARGVAAEVSGDTCLFSVAAGATAQIRRTLLMTGADTAGEAVRDQRLAIQVGLRGEAPHATVRSQPVTVVSAPSADLVIRPANPRSAHRWSDAASGAFQILALPVTRPGFAPLKGAASGGAWTARVDVSAFPAGTEWEFKGTHPTPDAEGWLTLGPITGNGDLAFTIPGGWPAQAEGETTRYDVHLDVPSSAFASEDYLNNGSGWQPGTGSTKGHSTFDSAIGSTAGIPYPNNDYSAVSVYRELSLPPRPNPDPQQPALPSVFGKSVAYPNDPAQTAFEPGNMNWAAAPETGYSNPDRMTARAVGSQLRTELLVLTQHLSAPVAITVGDEWDPGQQSADGPLTVLRPDGSALDPASYAVEWSTSATGTAIADAAVTAGWVRQPVAIPGLARFACCSQPERCPRPRKPVPARTPFRSPCASAPACRRRPTLSCATPCAHAPGTRPCSRPAALCSRSSRPRRCCTSTTRRRRAPRRLGPATRSSTGPSRASRSRSAWPPASTPPSPSRWTGAPPIL